MTDRTLVGARGSAPLCPIQTAKEGALGSIVAPAESDLSNAFH